MVLPDNLRGRGKDKGWGEVQVRARVRGRFTVEVLQTITSQSITLLIFNERGCCTKSNKRA